MTRATLSGALMLTLLLAPIAPAFGDESAIAEEAYSEEQPLIEEPAVLETASSTPREALEQEVPPTIPMEPAAESQELIVKLKESKANINLSSGRSEAAAAAAAIDGSVEEHLHDANSVVMRVDADTDLEDAIEALKATGAVEYAEPNYPRAFGAVIYDDPSFGVQWGLENTGQTVSGTAGIADADIDAASAWETSLGTSTLVAVIDSGVLHTHPDLANRLWDGSSCVSESGLPLGGCIHGYDFADDDTDPAPVATTTSSGYHGTHVAGIVAAEAGNAEGIVGVAPQARVMALRFGLDVASEVRAIDFAIANGAKIINASFGGSQYSQAEYDAIARFRDAGGIFIAAAGNGGPDSIGDDNDAAPVYPASYDLSNIVAVAATGQSDELAPFSNYGATSVDLGAPGRRIYSTFATGGTAADYDYLSGTSMAAPHVAGTLALLMSAYPDASTATYISAILESGDTVANLATTTTGTRLNAASALAFMAGDITPPVITLTGDAYVSLTRGDTYVEAGATALDETDGDVPVIIGGDTVDTGTAGTYVVTYDAEDAAGNDAVQVTRTVTVEEPEEQPRRRSGGGGGGGGSRTRSVENPARELFMASAVAPASGPYASLTPEQRALLLQTLLQLLAKLQAQLALIQAAGR